MANFFFLDYGVLSVKSGRRNFLPGQAKFFADDGKIFCLQRLAWKRSIRSVSSFTRILYHHSQAVRIILDTQSASSSPHDLHRHFAKNVQKSILRSKWKRTDRPTDRPKAKKTDGSIFFLWLWRFVCQKSHTKFFASQAKFFADGCEIFRLARRILHRFFAWEFQDGLHRGPLARESGQGPRLVGVEPPYVTGYLCCRCWLAFKSAKNF